MRSVVLLIGIFLAVPTSALAKPTVAVAPLEGDSGNKVGNVVAKAAADEAKVIGPKDTGRAMDKLGMSGELTKKDQKKLRTKLEADVVVQGKVDTDGSKKSVEIVVAGRGVKSGRFKLHFKSATSTSFRNDLRDALSKRLAPAGKGEDEDDEDDEPKKPKKLTDSDDETAKRPKRTEEDAPKKRAAADDEDEGAVRKKRRKRRDDDEDEATPRHAVTQVAVRVNAGGAFGRRGLDYEATDATMAPTRVGVASGSARVEGEIYPGSFSTLKGVAAGIGLYGEFDKAIGLSIRIPNTNTSVPINQGHYEIGVRYRAAFGTSSLAFGLGYARRHFIADRSGLAMPTALDMPDVDYAAIAPGALVRVAAGPNAGVFIGAAALLMTGAGQIVKTDGFGFADITAFQATGGVDIALAKTYGLRFAAELAQIGLAFKGMVRGVTAATDRTIGITATFEVTY